jgi:predicted N-formylglutamate amidohydrolase
MPLVVTCEHASGALPRGVDLGLTDAVLETHVSFDRGAREIATALARAASAPLHLGAYSRLLVDLNRREDNPAVILAQSYGIDIPGNVIDEPERMQRIERYHRPYREAARADVLRAVERGFCLHLSIHSFDPSLDPIARAFDAGVLFDPSRHPEAEIAAEIAEKLRGMSYSMRENEPYAGTPEGLTSYLRAQIDEARYVGIEIEASQAWVAREGACESFARSLLRSIEGFLAP